MRFEWFCTDLHRLIKGSGSLRVQKEKKIKYFMVNEIFKWDSGGKNRLILSAVGQQPVFSFSSMGTTPLYVKDSNIKNTSLTTDTYQFPHLHHYE